MAHLPKFQSSCPNLNVGCASGLGGLQCRRCSQFRCSEPNAQRTPNWPCTPSVQHLCSSGHHSRLATQAQASAIGVPQPNGSRRPRPSSPQPAPLLVPDLAQFDSLVPTISLDDILSGKPLPDNAFGDSEGPQEFRFQPADRPPPPPVLPRRALRPWEKAVPADPSPPAPKAAAPVHPPRPSRSTPREPARTHTTGRAPSDVERQALQSRPTHPTQRSSPAPDRLQPQFRPEPAATRTRPTAGAGGVPGTGRATAALAARMEEEDEDNTGVTGRTAEAMHSRNQAAGNGAGARQANGAAPSQPSSTALGALVGSSWIGPGSVAATVGQSVRPSLLAAIAPAREGVGVVRSTRVPRSQRVRSQEWVAARDAVRVAEAKAAAEAAAAAAAAVNVWDDGYEFVLPDEGLGSRSVPEAASNGGGRARQGPGAFGAATAPASWGDAPSADLYGPDAGMVSEPRDVLVVPEGPLRGALDAAAADQRLGTAASVSVADGVARPRAAAALAAAASLTPADLPDLVTRQNWRLHAAVLFPEVYDAEWHGCLFDFFFELWPEVGRAHVASAGAADHQTRRLLSTEAELAAFVAAEAGGGDADAAADVAPATAASPVPSARRRRAAELVDAAYCFAARCAASRDFAISSALVVSVLDCVDDHDVLPQHLAARLPAALVQRVLCPLLPRFQPEWVVEEWAEAVAAAHPGYVPVTVPPEQWTRLVDRLTAAQVVHHGTGLGVLHAVLHFDSSWVAAPGPPASSSSSPSPPLSLARRRSGTPADPAGLRAEAEAEAPAPSSGGDATAEADESHRRGRRRRLAAAEAPALPKQAQHGVEAEATRGPVHGGTGARRQKARRGSQSPQEPAGADGSSGQGATQQQPDAVAVSSTARRGRSRERNVGDGDGPAGGLGQEGGPSPSGSSQEEAAMGPHQQAAEPPKRPRGRRPKSLSAGVLSGAEAARPVLVTDAGLAGTAGPTEGAPGRRRGRAAGAAAGGTRRARTPELPET